MSKSIALFLAVMMVPLMAPAHAGPKPKDKKGRVGKKGDARGKKAKPAPKDLRVTVQIPLDGLRSNDDAEYLRKVLRQKLGSQARCDVMGRDTILLKVEQGCKVSLLDLGRVVEKVARKRRLTLRIGDPQLRGRVELTTRLKRPRPDRVRAMVAKLKGLAGVTPEQENSRSVKRLPLEISSESLRVSDIQRTIVASLQLGRKRQTIFRDVIWHGPPGGDGGAAGRPSTGPRSSPARNKPAMKMY